MSANTTIRSGTARAHRAVPVYGTLPMKLAAIQEGFFDSLANGKFSRRKFNKAAVAVGASAMMPGGIAGAAKTAPTGSWLDQASDSQLLNTPEEKWIGLISKDRLNGLVKKAPQHGAMEVMNKVLKITQYGASGVPKNALDAVNTVARDWKVSQSEALKAASEILDNDDVLKVGQALRKYGKKLGVRKDLGRADHPIEQRIKQQKREEEHYDREDNMERDFDRDAINRWSDEGGANFESRLNHALGLISESTKSIKRRR